MKITSVNNNLIKDTAKLLQKKYRDESGLFLLEGNKCIEEAIEAGLQFEHIFIKEGHEQFGNIENIEVSDAILSKISSTASPPKAIAVAHQISRKWSKKYKKVILLEGIKDAGNLGTILRTSAAFDIDAVILFGDTVDLYNPKCVRSSVGNLWKLPVFSLNDTNSVEKIFKSYEKIATLPKSRNSIWLQDYRPSEKLLMMFGSEADGLSEELKKLATNNVTIKMSNNVESLNLGVSVGIILHHLMN